MNPPAPTVEWLMSAYDATWHAFPTAQVNNQTRTFFQALCQHSVPPRHTEHTPPRLPCPTCLVLHGTYIPDDQRWQMNT
jgi:hypothetical protein